MGNNRTVSPGGWTEPRLGRLCEVAAAAISPGRRNSGLSVSSRSCLDTDEADDTTEHVSNNFKVVEVVAFASVHDMIHAAIASYGKQATLREIYRACQQRGRIAYKRSGGSRLITHNDHWKSQIRHALYTCDRFARAADAHDLWTVSAPFNKQQPQTTKVLIRTDPDAASVNDDSADAERRQGGAKQPLLRHTRSKHTLDAPLLQATPKQKRSRTTRLDVRTPPPVSSAAARTRSDFMATPTSSVAFSNGPSNRMLSGSDYSDLGERAASASAFQPYSCDASTAAGTSVLQHEGEDESSHNDTCMQLLPQVYLHDGLPVSYEPGLVGPPPGVVHRGLPVLDVHPYFTECHDAHQIVASSMAAAHAQRQPGQSHSTQSPHAFLTPPHHPLPSARQPVSQNNSQPHQLISPHHQQPPNHHQQSTSRSWLQPGLRRTLSGEVESPAESEVYSLRSRRAPRALTDPPTFHDSPTGHPSHSVHDFFMCHTKPAEPSVRHEEVVAVQVAEPVAAAAPYSSPHLGHLSSTMHSNLTDSSPIRRTVIRQGVAGKPPVLPKNGRTQSLLAAAHQAQSAAFPVAAPFVLEHDREQDNVNKAGSVAANHSYHITRHHSTPSPLAPDTGEDVSTEPSKGKLLRSRRLIGNDG